MEKRRYLYYNLKKIDKHKNDIIYKYIIDKNIECNENNNGLLINLSILPEDHINNLINLYNLKENKINYDLSKFKVIPKKKNIKKKKQYKKYEYNKLEKMIRSYS